MKAAMKIMAFTNVGMRSQLDSHEPEVVLRHCESGMVEFCARGKVRALVMVIVKNTSNMVEWRKCMFWGAGLMRIEKMRTAPRIYIQVQAGTSEAFSRMSPDRFGRC